MKEKTREPIPMVRIEHSKNHSTEIFVLDEGDSMAWNNSTNYDHHMSGPSLVFKTRSPSGGIQINETYVNDPSSWEYIDRMIQLGMKYLEENPDFNMQKFKGVMNLRRKQYADHKHVSHHKSKSN